MQQKIKKSSRQEASLRGRVRDSDSFIGLLSELFWCHRLTQLEYSFNAESETGGTDFKIKLDQRTIHAEVKTLQELTESKELRVLISDLKQTIDKRIKDCSGIFLISIQIGRNFSRNTIKPLAAIIRKTLQEMSLSQKENTFNYPEDASGHHNNQAKGTISRDIGEKTGIMIKHSAKLSNVGKLLKGALDTARKQSGINDINVVFIDKTFRSDLEDEDIQDVLYGKLVHAVSFSEELDRPESITPFRRNDGFYEESSRISAVIVYQRKRWGMSDIQDANIYPHPELCELTETEMQALERLSGC